MDCRDERRMKGCPRPGRKTTVRRGGGFSPAARVSEGKLSGLAFGKELVINFYFQGD